MPDRPPRKPGSFSSRRRRAATVAPASRVLLVSAGFANDCDALRADPAFKMALGRVPESVPDLCLPPVMSRLENLPSATGLKWMTGGMVELFCDSFGRVLRRIVLDVDDTISRSVEVVEATMALLALHCCNGGELTSASVG